MKIVFFGTPQFAVPTLEALLAHPDCEVVAIVTQPDKRRGRGGELSASPIKSVALTHRLPVWQPKSIKKDAETLEKLQSAQADSFVVVAYGQILSQAILEMPKLGCVNVHGSLLPKYRGAAPIQWCLYHGETETGITTMQMDAGMDTGAMLLKAVLPIALLDNAHDVAAKLATIGADLLIETLLKRGEIQAIAQNDSQATYAPLIKKPDYALNWTRSAIDLHNQIRGFFPNCVTSFRGTILKIITSAPLTSQVELPPELAQLCPDLPAANYRPGAVVAVLKNVGFVVQTGAGLLLLRDVQLAGKPPRSGWDFANGTRLEIGESLGA
ncbi:MAG: methionyl-tRNA formyltransferase [Leptolyngbyaceae cyanobacterium CSU_1_3]|nr:methionyl-tRNA formyltransferase [Leptolyngbyaceae cyanobacterium CSU_1_3]